MFAVRTAPGPFPWRDGAFDTVACLDTLEHMPADVREPFVAECARVAARQVFLACPTVDGAALDRFFRAMYEGVGVEPPAWLDEHDEHGLPTAAEVEAACTAAVGMSAEPWAQVNGLLASLAAIADLHPLLAADAVARIATTARNGSGCCARALRPLVAGRVRAHARAGTRGARARGRLHSDGGAGALRCPACGGAVERAAGDELRCTGCAHLLVPDATGAYDLRPQPRPSGRARWWRRSS